MGRRLRTWLFVLIILSAGCVAPTHSGPDEAPTGERSDPTRDRLGWEGGLWYDDPIDVNESDGLNESALSVVLNRTMARIEHIRRLEFEKPVTVDVISRSTYREEYVGSGSANTDRRTFENVKQEALFLVGETEDSVETERENRGSSVLGFYAPGRDRIVIVSDTDSPTVNVRTLAHELVHALQDQHFGFDISRGDGTAEGGRAGRAVIEGDARFVDRRYMDRCDGAWSCIEQPENAASESDNDSSETASSLHRGLYLVSIFVYVDGSAFVSDRFEEGGWDAVNELYTKPPASSEQVIDPAKYRVDPPTNVTLADTSTRDWDRVSPPGNRPQFASIGQPGLVAMFAYPSYDTSRSRESVVGRSFLNVAAGASRGSDPLNYDIPYANGWDGDKLWIYENASGANAYVWRIVWDTPGDATEFAEGYREVLRYWGGEPVGDGTWRIPEGESEFADAFAIRVSGDTVTIVNAPTSRQLPGVYGPLRR